MRTIDMFGVLGRPHLGYVPEPLLACPIAGSNNLYTIRRVDGTAVGTNAMTMAEARAISPDVTVRAPGDARCSGTPGEPAAYLCPIGGGKAQMTDLLTGRRILDTPVNATYPDDPLCPGYAERQAAPPPPPPPPGPAPVPPPAQHPDRIVLVPYPQPVPVPVGNQLVCDVIQGQQICRPALYPAPAPPVAPIASPAPAPAAAAGGPSTLAIAGGAGALGLLTLLATGVIKL